MDNIFRGGAGGACISRLRVQKFFTAFMDDPSVQKRRSKGICFENVSSISASYVLLLVRRETRRQTLIFKRETQYMGRIVLHEKDTTEEIRYKPQGCIFLSSMHNKEIFI